MKNLPFILILLAWLIAQTNIFQLNQIKTQLQDINTYQATVISEAEELLIKCSTNLQGLPIILIKIYNQAIEDYKECKENNNLEACEKIQYVTEAIGESNG